MNTSDIEAVDVTKELTGMAAYMQETWPKLLNFGIRVVLAIIAFIIGKCVIKWVRSIVKRAMQRSSADIGVVQFVDSLLKFGLYIILVFGIATKLGVESASAAALLASGGVAIGLALQGSLSNFAGGVLILLLKPFCVGDYIIEDTHGNEGTVKEIQIFYTKLATVDNKTIVIPNGILANSSLTNVTAKDERRLDLEIGISYQADLKKAKQLIENLLQEDACILKDEEILVYVSALEDSAVIIGTRSWVKTEEYWTTRWRVLENIKLTLDEHEIEIPYNQLTVHLPQQDIRDMTNS
ncbi:MAG: mechanosensitive ion channel [Hespellia sp.]|nr:mechanosensitive ion channel [Hespellia sp.]